LTRARTPGQTLALIEGVELFTKSEVAQQYSDLEPFMKRDASVPSRLPTLNAFRDRLVSHLRRVKVIEKGTDRRFALALSL
jgi:hypothetical protein